MHISSIIELKLGREEFKKYTSSNDYSVIGVTKLNYIEYYDSLLHISTLMFNELKWDGVPDIKTTIERLNSNSKCLLWLYQNQPIGWAWSNDNVTQNWIDIDQELKVDEVYGGGAFLTRSVHRPSDAGLAFYSLTFQYWFEDLNKTTIFQYSDNWNRVSTILSMKCGFQRYKFLQ